MSITEKLKKNCHLHIYFSQKNQFTLVILMKKFVIKFYKVDEKSFELLNIPAISVHINGVGIVATQTALTNKKCYAKVYFYFVDVDSLESILFISYRGWR